MRKRKKKLIRWRVCSKVSLHAQKPLNPPDICEF